jgi:hypothetical protein
MQINPYHANGLGEVFQMKFEFRLLIFLLILYRKYLLFSYLCKKQYYNDDTVYRQDYSFYQF